MVLTLRLFSARRRQKNPAETSFNSRGGYAKWGILGQLLRAALAPHCEPCGSKRISSRPRRAVTQSVV
jgi:hypothetical protein